MTVATRNLVGVQFSSESGATTVPFLGHITWTSIADFLLPFEDTRALLTSHGFDPDLAPNHVCPANALRKAAKGAETCQYEDNGVRVQIFSRIVAMGHAQTTAAFIRETIDRNRVRMGWDPVYKLTVSNSNWWEFEGAWEGEPDPRLDVSALTESYERYIHCADISALRRIVARAMARMHPIPLRPSGSIYFVPIAYQGDLERLKQMLRSAPSRSSGSHRLEMIPVIDAPDQRDMIQVALGEDLVRLGRGIIEEAMDAREREAEGRDVSDQLKARLRTEMDGLNEKLAAYEGALDTNLVAARKAVADAREELHAVLGRDAGIGGGAALRRQYRKMDRQRPR